MATTKLAGIFLRSGSVPVTALGGGVVSSSAQLVAAIPVGTVSSSAQFPGMVTASSQIDYNSIQNKLSGVVSSSTQVKPLLPANTISSSTQLRTLSDPFTGSFTGSFKGDGSQLINIGAITLPAGTVSSSAQYPGWVTSSTQVLYTSLQSIPLGIVSSSTQIQPLLPANTISSSAQFRTITDPFTGSFTGSLTGTFPYSGLTSVPVGIASSSTQVKSLLPAGTVTSSAQFPGWVTASSQIDYNQIQNKLSGVISSSAQVAPLLPVNTVSSSTQFRTITDPFTGSFTGSFAGTHTGTFPYTSLTSIPSGIVSSSTQVKPLLPAGTVSSSGQITVQNTAGISALATTGSNVFTANQTVTGSLFITQNLVVQGSSSISFISQSTLNIGTNIITVNTNQPSIRFGGLEVIDSGSSPQRSGSLYFDSLRDQWIFVHQNTAAGVTSSVIVMGPPTFNNVGNETLLTQNRILKGGGLEHISDSQISDNDITVSITRGLSVGTTISASGANISGLTGNQAVFTDANDNLVSVATTGTGNAVREGSPTLTGTLTAANITATGTMLLAGIVSQSSQINYNLIQNKLSGVYSSSAFTTVNQGTLRLSFNGVALSDVDTGLQSTDAPLFSGSQFSGIVSGSGTQYRLVVPVGTNLYAT